MNLVQIILLALVQGAAELLPVSSSAHVIVAEKLMGLDPSTPEMTFLLVMLHTGTMFAVLLYFWSRWRKLDREFFKKICLATVVTGLVGFGLKKVIEKLILEKFLGYPHGEIEHLFKNLLLISASLFSVGLLIIFADRYPKKLGGLTKRSALWIGWVQGLCLPFRGFSRSGATISTGLISGVSRELAEEFSFALAVCLTPPVIALELHRLMKASSISGESLSSGDWKQLLGPGLLGMCFSFAAGLMALKWLSAWLEAGRWKYFGIYCITASVGILVLHFVL